MELEQQGLINISGKNIEYRWITNASRKTRPVIVMLHEGLGSVSLWKEFPETLSEETGCDIFVYSRPGYGNSDPVDLPRPIEYMHYEGHTVLPEILEMFDQDIFLLGHSDGASVSIIYAGTHQNNRLKGLVLFAPHVFTEEVCIRSIQNARKFYDENEDFRKKLSRHHKNVYIAFNGWCDAWLDPRFLDWNIEEYIENVHVPTLVIQGHDDEYGTIEQVDRIKNKVKHDFESVLLEDCKHSPHRDREDETLTAINNFVLRYQN
ncbi:MAG: alpha/beta hydrolase [Gammaproteobacteria bacterium]|nr:alpha/beta hydrolase [Gammaproteobacteria bacterium]